MKITVTSTALAGVVLIDTKFFQDDRGSVSYTHLTLPTIYSV